MTGEANYLVAPVPYSLQNDDDENKEVITKSSYYALNTWWNLQGFPQGIPTYDQIKNDVRGSGMIAITLATVGRYAGYDSNAVTLDLAKVRLNAARLICGAANSHISNLSGGWYPRTWQTALWAFNIGLAGWMLMRTDLTNVADQERLCKMVIWEANRLLKKSSPFWRYPNDAVYIEPTSDPDALPRQGDSAFEENGWNAMLLYLAHCMMPQHANSQAWLSKAIRMTIAGAATKADLNNDDDYLHGHPISHWIAGGYNLRNDYTVVNHDKINPDYQQALHLQLFPAILFGLANKPIPEALAFNARRIYGAMQTVEFNNKSMYNYGTPTVYYPQGTDWGTRRPSGFYAMDAFMDILDLGYVGSLIPIPASYWADLHLQDTRAMQSGRPGLMPGGQIILNAQEDSNGSREEWAMHNHASVALLQTLANAGRIDWTDETIYLPCTM